MAEKKKTAKKTTARKSSKKRKKSPLLRGILIALLVLVLIVLSYCAYVFITYSRIEDNVPLSAEGNTATPAETGKTYTVVTQNFGFGAYTPDFTFFLDGGTKSRANSADSVENCLAQCAKKLKEQKPDFIFLQEIDTDSDRSYHIDQRKYFSAQFSDYASVFATNFHSAYLFWPVYSPHGKSNSGLQTLSSCTVTSSLRRSLPVSKSVSKILDLDRCYLISRVPVKNGKELVLFNLHTSAYGNSAELRTAQLTQLFSDMKAEYEKGNYVIAGGDFNHDFTGDSSRTFNGSDSSAGWAQPFPADLIPEHFARCISYSNDPIPSCRDCDVPATDESCKMFIVDGFIVSDNVTVSDTQVLTTSFAYSDHQPVRLQFVLK